MLPLIKHTTQITILYDSQRKTCDAACGVDWSSPEAIALARQQIKDRFGNKTRLQYFDLSKPQTGHDMAEWNQIITNKNLSLPLLLINGEPRISGEFDYRQLLDATEAEMELEA